MAWHVESELILKAYVCSVYASDGESNLLYRPRRNLPYDERKQETD